MRLSFPAPIIIGIYIYSGHCVIQKVSEAVIVLYEVLVN